MGESEGKGEGEGKGVGCKARGGSRKAYLPGTLVRLFFFIFLIA